MCVVREGHETPDFDQHVWHKPLPYGPRGRGGLFPFLSLRVGAAAVSGQDCDLPRRPFGPARPWGTLVDFRLPLASRRRRQGDRTGRALPAVRGGRVMV